MRDAASLTTGANPGILTEKTRGGLALLVATLACAAPRVLPIDSVGVAPVITARGALSSSRASRALDLEQWRKRPFTDKLKELGSRALSYWL